MATNVALRYLLRDKYSVIDEMGSSPISKRMGFSGVLSLSQSSTPLSEYVRILLNPCEVIMCSAVLANYLGATHRQIIRTSTIVSFSFILTQAFSSSRRRA